MRQKIVLVPPTTRGSTREGPPSMSVGNITRVTPRSTLPSRHEGRRQSSPPRQSSWRAHAETNAIDTTTSINRSAAGQARDGDAKFFAEPGRLLVTNDLRRTQQEQE
ncbi:unnamed protein product [Sphacelaria rigidula]